MTSPASRGIGQRGLPTIPTGDVVASYPTYEAARHAVDVLVREEGFPVESISVVGSDLKSVERITGRMNYGRAALSGLMNGVMIAIFVSLIWFIFFPNTDFLSIVGVFVMSIAFGVIWGILGYALSSQKREFTSIMQVTASRFDIVVPHNMSTKVRDTLQRGGSWSSPQVPAPGQQTQWPQPGQPTAGQPAPYQSAPYQSGQDGAQLAGTHSSEAQPTEAQPGQSQPAEPAHPPRTYGEMQDELRRQERERQQQSGQHQSGQQ